MLHDTHITIFQFSIVYCNFYVYNNFFIFCFFNWLCAFFVVVSPGCMLVLHFFFFSSSYFDEFWNSSSLLLYRSACYVDARSPGLIVRRLEKAQIGMKRQLFNFKLKNNCYIIIYNKYINILKLYVCIHIYIEKRQHQHVYNR